MPDVKLAPPLDEPQVVPTKRPFSNFEFLEQQLGPNFSDPIKRLFSQARVLGYKTLTVEKIENTGFSKEDDDDLAKAGIRVPSDHLIRLGFFKSEFFTYLSLRRQSDANFLGYAILKKIPLRPKYEPANDTWIVFEAVMAPPPYKNNYLHGYKYYKIAIGDKLFNVRGNLFCQQNSLTNVCAHAALRSCLSVILPSGDYSYAAMNKILTDAHDPHIIDRHALSTEQIYLILDTLGIKYSKHAYSPSTTVQVSYQSYLYSSIESGYPALLAFWVPGEKTGHIIPVLGHTFDEDMWVPKADPNYFQIGKDTRYIPSESWVSSYICHDDNFGPCYCVPRHYINETKHGILVIATKPAFALYDALDAEALAAECLYTLESKISEEIYSNTWAKRLAGVINTVRPWFVLRTFLISPNQYIKHLKSIRGWDYKSIPPKMIKVLKENLKSNLWISEISLPELFPANRRKLGEVILYTDQPRDFSSFAFARILNNIYFIYYDENKEMKLERHDIARINTHTELFPEDRYEPTPISIFEKMREWIVNR